MVEKNYQATKARSERKMEVLHFQISININVSKTLMEVGRFFWYKVTLLPNEKSSRTFRSVSNSSRKFCCSGSEKKATPTSECSFVLSRSDSFQNVISERVFRFHGDESTQKRITVVSETLKTRSFLNYSPSRSEHQTVSLFEAQYFYEKRKKILSDSLSDKIFQMYQRKEKSIRVLQ